MTTRPTVLSGIQPSGRLTLGNYLGAIKNWLPLSQDYDCHYMLVDLHAITQRQDPAMLRDRCYEFIALYIACGLDPKDNVLFVQSHVSAHARLSWILNCYTQFGELSRMTQFKDKSAKLLSSKPKNMSPGILGGAETTRSTEPGIWMPRGEEVSVGLFNYPVLMAADILLYDASQVPVGDDQKQHLELTRDIAQRFNNIYGAPKKEIFVVPEPMIPPVGARIMGLQDPTAKMSKSDDAETNALYLLDPPDIITRKIKRAVTDTGSEVRFDINDKPGVSNLLSILAATTGKTIAALEEEFAGKQYGAFKGTVADAVVECLKPVQTKYNELREDREGLRAVLKDGAARASVRADATLKRVHDVLGFIPE